MSVLQFDLAELSPEQLVALTQAGLIAPAPANGKGEKQPEPAPVTEGWVNIAGVECANQFLAYISSLAIVKHLRGTCSCARGKECKVVSRYGYAADTFNSDASAEVPAHLIAEK